MKNIMLYIFGSLNNVNLEKEFIMITSYHLRRQKLLNQYFLTFLRRLTELRSLNTLHQRCLFY